MAPHSSTLAWKVPWTEEPGGLQSMRSQRVWHNWGEQQQQQQHSLIFFFFFKIFIFTLFYFTINSCTWVPNPEPPSHLPPHIISLDHPRAPAPNILYPVSNIDWQFVSYTIVYMFQCHSPKSSHPLPLPQSPKVRSIRLCLFCCLAYRVIITIFLNSIYMC